MRIGDTHEFSEAINLQAQIEDFTPPVSFYYIDAGSRSEIAEYLPNPIGESESAELVQFCSD